MSKHPESGMKLATLGAAALGLIVAIWLVPALASSMLKEYPSCGIGTGRG